MEKNTQMSQTIRDFISSAKGKVIIAGYGSLLSQYSRQTYSQIMGPGMPAIIKGWERNWITRSLEENQTYAGAIPNRNVALNAQLLALEFDASFAKRERDYRFTKVLPSNIIIENLSTDAAHAIHTLLEKTPVYICETLKVEPSTADFPVSLSYIETCLSGSYESCGEQGVAAFLEGTSGWDNTHFYDDRDNHRYPRSCSVLPVDAQKWGARYAAALRSFKKNMARSTK